MKNSVEVNFRDMSLLMKQLSDEGEEGFVRKDLLPAHRKAWQPVLESARERVPVDTGRLKESLRLKAGFNKKTGNLYAIVGLVKINARKRARIRDLKIQRKLSQTAIETDAFYAIFLERGTERMRARPFMTPAFDEHKSRVGAEYRDDATRRLQRRWKLFEQEHTLGPFRI